MPPPIDTSVKEAAAENHMTLNSWDNIAPSRPASSATDFISRHRQRALCPAHQMRQLRYIRRDPPRLPVLDSL
jgi:hypothetical protein